MVANSSEFSDIIDIKLLSFQEQSIHVCSGHVFLSKAFVIVVNPLSSNVPYIFYLARAMNKFCILMDSSAVN